MERDTRRRREEPDRYPPRRRKNKRSPVSSSMMYIVLVCAVSVVLAAVCWSLGNDVLALNKESTSATITVNDESDFGSVADQLKGNDIIKHKGLFKLFASLTGGKDKIAQGTYEVNSDMDYRALISGISANSASRAVVDVTIPEGYTVEEIFKLMENKGVCSYNDLLKVAQEETFDFDFLKDVKTTKEKRLEGYLFPDTYEFYKGADAKNVINTMLKNFDERFDSKMEAEMQLLGYSKNDIIIMASIIEKETDGSDQRNIASVIQNRLKNTWATPKGYLQVDSTIQYLLKERKKKLTDKDLEIDSPYNTYKNKGLPPGPIANPGMESITAALNPQSTNYYYYALGDDHLHHFFSSYAEHQAFLNS